MLSACSLGEDPVLVPSARCAPYDPALLERVATHCLPQLPNQMAVFPLKAKARSVLARYNVILTWDEAVERLRLSLISLVSMPMSEQ